MKKLLAYSVGFVGLVGSAAMAADLRAPVYKAPPAPPPVATDIWNGFYLGLNAGGAISRNHTTDTTVLTPGLDPFALFDAGVFNHAGVGGVFGAQVGWNWHAAPSWVLGVETDWQWSGQSETVCTYACLPTSGPQALLLITDEQALKWFGTTRGRVGWLSPGGSLLYATGGAAYGRVDQTLTLAATQNFFATGTGAAASFGNTKLGWTVGAGIETPIADRWSLKAEYLFVDLGKITNSFSTPVDPTVSFPATTQTTTSTSDIRDHIVRVGLNYHFDGPAGPYAAATTPMYTKAPVGAAPPQWNGFYVGGNAGVAIAHNATTDTEVVPGFAAVGGVPVLGADSFTHAPLGGVFGAQLGWNWQAAPSWVVGAEADWQWTHQTDLACISQCLPGSAFAGSFLLGATNDQTMTWLSTARGRAGWVAPGGALWYATGGVAWGHIDDTITLIATPGFFATGVPNGATFSHDKTGWTVGAGVEAPVGNRLSVKAEYLYVDLGSVTDSVTQALGPNAGGPPGTTMTTTTTYSIHDHIVRVGLNYHFN